MALSTLGALFLGALFGFALNKGGLTRYSKITGVFRFTDLTVIKFMLTALVVAMVGLYTLRGAGLIQFPAPPATYLAGNLIGGLVFGIGMALTGYWPGTCVAGSGEGKIDYFVSGFLGLLFGTLVYGLTYTRVYPKIAAIANAGNVVLPDLWNVSPFLLVLLFVLTCLFLFYLFERGLKRKDKVI